MQKKYLIVGWGFNKDTNEPYSKGLAVKEDNYNKVPQYGYADAKDIVYFSDIYELGKIVVVDLTVHC